MLVYFDAETRSEVDITSTSTYNYAEHESTDMLCMAFRVFGKNTKTYCVGFNNIQNGYYEEPMYILTRLAEDPRAAFISHNAMFDRLIWHNVMHRKRGWSDIPLERWRCSMALARYHGLPGGLDAAAQAIKLPMQKDKEGKNLINQLSHPFKPTKTQRKEFEQKGIPVPKWNKDPELMAKMESYCKDDVNTGYALVERLGQLPDYEQKVWILDQQINDRGITVDSENVERLIALTEQHKDTLKKEIYELTEGAIESPTQTKVITQYLQDKGLELSGIGKDIVEQELKRDDLDPHCRHILELRQHGSQSSTAKFQKMIDHKSPDNRLRGLMIYHKCHTGRWASHTVQLFNAPRDCFANDTMQEDAIDSLRDIDDLELEYGPFGKLVKKFIRPMLTAGPGKTLMTLDFAQIEARGSMWLVDDTEGLKLFKTKHGPYVAQAASIFRKSASKINKTERDIGKVAVLSLQYAKGSKAFFEQYQHLGVTKELSQRVVNTYRKERKKIVSSWYAIDGIVRDIIQSNTVRHLGPLKLWRDSRTLRIQLPSKRIISYRDIRIKTYIDKEGVERNCIGYTGHKGEMGTWGGKIFQNIIQALCRDILVEAMLRVRDAGYNIVLHLYDEIVVEVDEDALAMDHFEELMCVAPSWAKGFPIAADGWHGKRYKKG